MKTIQCGVVLGLWLVLASCGGSTGGSRESVGLPDYPVPGGVSAPFAGMVGNYMVVGGGCNFPDVPAADGGVKRFYSSLYALDMARPDSGWQALPDLPQALAYGAAAETDEGLVCVGGMDADSAVTRAFLIESQPGPDSMAAWGFRDLPPLPVAIDNGAAASVDGVVYVTGGNQSDGGRALYALDLDTRVWTRLPDYPAPNRVQPVLLAAGGKLYLAGGFSYDPSTRTCTIPADMVPYDVATRQWGNPVPFPVAPDGGRYAISGGSGVVVGNCLLLTGGVDYKIFKEAMEGRAPADYMKKPIEWYQFNNEVLLYNTTRGDWSVSPSVEGLNRAGGVLLLDDSLLIMVCGEVKPGVRSSQIGAFERCDTDGDTSVVPAGKVYTSEQKEQI